MPFSHESDRNLLFGIFALQVNFVHRDALLTAMNDWVRDKNKSLGQVLLEKGELTPSQVDVIDAVLAEHLKAHDNDVEHSFQAMADASPVCATYATVADDDVQSRLAQFASRFDADNTRPYHDHQPLDGGRFVRGRFYRRGGLGEVYYAQDNELNREVALKEIKPEYADDPMFRGRFVIEAEITGGLEHPGVVPVYGLGKFANGRPYYAMRFIRGENLKDAIEQFHKDETADRDPGERSIAFRQLLRRYIDMCNAVAYAHSRGVVHRDLKPANVMLGKYGETLVVDWGLAKLGVEPRHRPEDTSVEPVLRPSSGSSPYAVARGGTIPFMSPEQAAERDDIDPASDIYSLGSTLYVLLTGKRPYVGTDDDDTRAKVKRGVFLPPRAVNKKVPAALDAICRKAMSFDRADRYATALDLAADLEHWLADEPVGAFAEPWTARAGRWGRRHRTILVGSIVGLMVAVLALSISTGLIWAEQERVAEQKLLAEQNYRVARDQIFKTIDLMESSEVEFTFNPKLHATRKEILVAAARACRQFLARSSDDPELTQRAAQIYRYNANVHRFTYEVDEAEPLYRDAIRLLDFLVEKQPSPVMYQFRLSETLRDYAKLQANTGALGESAKTLERSIAAAKKVLPGHRRPMAASLLNLSVVEDLRGHFDHSNQYAEQAGNLFRELLDVPESDRHPYDGLLLASALNVRARAERERANFEQATLFHAEAIAQMQGIVKRRPAGVSNADLIHFTAIFRLEQSRTYIESAQKPITAEKNLVLTIGEWEKLARAFPRVPMYRESLAEAHQLVGRLQGKDVKRAAEARVNLEKSRDLLKEVVKEAPKMPEARGTLGRSYFELAQLTERQKAEGAETHFRTAAKELAMALEQSPENFFNLRSYRSIPKEYVDETKK